MVDRVEIITGKERRRRWSEDEKRRLASEAFAPGEIVAHVARRHGVAESCLYAWRKRFAGAVNKEPSGQPQLVPVVIGAAATPTLGSAHRAVITLPDSTRLEFDAGYPVAALKALVRALRTAR